MNDPIVEEVWRVRNAHAARFNYDLDAIFQDIKEQEKKSGRVFVSFPPHRLDPNQGQHPAEAAEGAEPERLATRERPCT